MLASRLERFESMSTHLDFWFDFSCPYAYLAATRVEAAARRMGLALRPCPVLLGGMLRAVGSPDRPADEMPEPKRVHGRRDIERLSALWDVPLTPPPGHPLRTVEALRVLLAAGEPFMPLAHALFRAYWVEGLDPCAPATLRGVLQTTGHDPDAVLEKAGTDEVKRDLRSRTDEALAAGVFGVPTFRASDRIIWGVDRLHVLERSLGGDAVPPGGEGEEIVHRDAIWPTTFFFDFSSPFAAVASARVEDVFQDAVRFHPMLLGAVFRAIGTPMVPLATFHEAKRRWARSDLLRQARENGFPLQWPSRFPMNTVLPLRVTLLAGPNSTAGRALVHALYLAYWSQDRDIADPQVVADVARTCGLDGDDLVARAAGTEAKQALREHTDEALARGVFGAPTCVVDAPDGRRGLFWGSDRVQLAGAAARGNTSLL